MYKLKLISTSIAVALAITGCQTTSETNSQVPTRSAYTSTKFQPDMVQTRLNFYSQCPMSNAVDGLGAFGEVFIPAAIDYVVSGFTAAIKKAGEDKVSQSSGYKDNHFYKLQHFKHKSQASGYKLNDAVKCLTITSGKFSTDADAKSEVLPDHFKSMGLTNEPAFYIELEFEHSKDGKMFRLVPRHLIRNQYFDQDNKGKARDLTFALDFRTPGGTAENGTFATTLFEFKGIELGTEYTASDFKNTGADWQLSSPWMKLPGIETHKTAMVTEYNTSVKALSTLNNALCASAWSSAYSNDSHANVYNNIVNSEQCKNHPWEKHTNEFFSQEKYAKAQQKAQRAALALSDADLASQLAADNSDEAQALAKLKREQQLAESELKSMELVGPKKQQIKNLKKAVLKSGQRLIDIAQLAGDFEVFLTLAEVKTGNRFFKALGEIVANSKEPLTNYLKNKNDPATKAANAETAAAGAETQAQQKYELLLLLYQAEYDLQVANAAVLAATDESSKAQAMLMQRKAQLTLAEYQRRLALMQD